MISICSREKISFKQEGKDTFIINGVSFNDYKKALSYIYAKEAKK